MEKDLYLFNENIFKIVGKDSALLTAGNINQFNTMTIAWATLGVIWGKNVMTVYVRPSRHTYSFMENNEYFTVSFYKNDFKKELAYLGTHSGRNTNKVKDVDFHPIVLDNDTTSFKEARLTFILKKLYYQDLDDSKIGEDIKNRYYKTDDFHRAYIGEIVKIIENE